MHFNQIKHRIKSNKSLQNSIEIISSFIGITDSTLNFILDVVSGKPEKLFKLKLRNKSISSLDKIQLDGRNNKTRTKYLATIFQ
jgi:hypothetical protein